MHSRSRVVVAACLALAVAACALEPPISIGKKESAVGQGMVVSLTNTSDDFLHDVVMEITSPSGEIKQHAIASLSPHESVNVGWLKLDGWPIPQGSSVSVKCKGFALAAGAQL